MLNSPSMAANTVGGLWITTYDFTRSFGVEPASASGKAVLGLGSSSAGLDVGEYRVYSFGGLSFFGIVSQVIGAQERTSGVEYDFQMVDNRVRLPGKIFFGQFNMPEDYALASYRGLVRPPAGEFSSGGASGGDGMDWTEIAAGPTGSSAGSLDPAADVRGRVFGHIVPSMHPVQLKSYTDAAVSAADILRSAFKSALGSFSFSLDLHPDCSLPVYEIDANSGMSLASLVAEVCDQLGLQVTLDGSRTLRFERRGEGSLVIPAGVHLRRDGQAMSSEPTMVCITGERTLVQVNNLTLEPDWQRAWEAFLAEPAWLDEVSRVFGEFTEDTEGRAELAAKAREVTLRQYIANASLGAGAALWIDRGRWGKVSRLNMPVWTYLNSIVFRSYRIGDDRYLYGLPMRALEMHDSLLCGVEIVGEGAAAEIGYSSDPVQLYPEASAFVIARGQPLDLIAAADRESIVRARLKDMRDEWSDIADFTVDTQAHAIRFASPVFLDGDPAEGKSIMLYPNRGEGGFTDVSDGLAPGSEFLSVVVPNPGYEIAPAEVKIAAVFRLGNWQSFHGSGQRYAVHNAAAIALHLLDDANGISHSVLGGFTGNLPVPNTPGAGLKEIKYDDGATAAEKAEEQAQGRISRSSIERSGEYLRHGAAGTTVTGVIDRVSIHIDKEGGIVETVEFAKPRSSSNFVPSRDFARRARTEELFSGQASLRREARMLAAIARLGRNSINDPVRSASHQVMTDLFRTPVGGPNPSSATFDDPNSQWPVRDGVTGWRAGDLCWLDAEGLPSRTGTTLGGIVVATPPAGVKWVTLGSNGTVPVSVAPGAGPGDALVANPGDWKAGLSGTYPIGMSAHGEAVPGSGEATLALVRLNAGGGGGGGGGTVVRIPPLTIATARPAYIPAPSGGPADGDKRVWFHWGSCAGKLAENWAAHFDCPQGEGEPDTWFWAEVNFAPSSAILTVTSWNIRSGTAEDEYENPLWPPNTRPTQAYHPLGRVFAEGGTVFNTGGGSLLVSQHIETIEASFKPGVANLRSAIFFQREGY